MEVGPSFSRPRDTGPNRTLYHNHPHKIHLAIALYENLVYCETRDSLVPTTALDLLRTFGQDRDLLAATQIKDQELLELLQNV